MRDHPQPERVPDSGYQLGGDERTIGKYGMMRKEVSEKSQSSQIQHLTLQTNWTVI